MTNNEFLLWLEENIESIQTPVYVYSESNLENSLVRLKAIFPGNVRIFYSLKANPQPCIVRYLSELGAGSEIASIGERRMCSFAGVPNDDILVGGVSKSTEYLSSVCEEGSAAIVVESLTEWRRLREVLKSRRQAKVLLRVNPGVSTGGLDMAGASQFGMSPEQSIVIAKECRENTNSDFIGLHFYFGSQRLTGDPIVQMVKLASEVVETFKKANVRINVVDLGLGCGVPYLEKDQNLDMYDLRDRLLPLWKNPIWSSIGFWTEAGRILVGSSGFYVSRVLERKVRQNKVFIFLDGGINVHNPGIGVGRFFRSNPRFQFVCKDGSQESEIVDIVGNLCTSADCLGQKVTVPILKEGDLVVIPNSGAYCQTTGLWGFNSQSLFSEAMLSRKGRLSYIEPQYRLILKPD